MNSMRALLAVSAQGKTVPEVEAAIESALRGLGLDPKGFNEAMHYVVPTYEVTGKPWSNMDKAALLTWRKYRALGNAICYELLGHAQLKAEVRIWPHHFDTGFYVTLNDHMGLGFGLAMHDTVADAPYFYMAGYPVNGSITYNDLPNTAGWEWKTDDRWKGAILPLPTLEEMKDDQRQELLSDCLMSAFKWFLCQ